MSEVVTKRIRDTKGITYIRVGGVEVGWEEVVVVRLLDEITLRLQPQG